MESGHWSWRAELELVHRLGLPTCLQVTEFAAALQGAHHAACGEKHVELDMCKQCHGSKWTM